MGKKSDTAARVTTERPASTVETVTAAPPSAVAIPEPVLPAAAINGEVKAGKKKKARKAAKKSAGKKKAVFSTEDVALRAYFISEHRQQHGLPGDSHSDWIEAERQLKAEHRKKKKKVVKSKG